MQLSVLLAVVAALPVTTVFWPFPTRPISMLSGDQGAIEFGAVYLRIVGPGVPFVGLDFIGSRALVGSDDVYTVMTLCTGGAVINITLNMVLTSGLDPGVEGVAPGTVLSNVVVIGTFAVGLLRGPLPDVGVFPTVVDSFGSFPDTETICDLVKIGAPVVGRSPVRTVTESLMSAIPDSFGPDAVTAFVIARRIRGLVNTPGWGFGPASLSLAGQAFGRDGE